jgi:TonB family protein
MSSGSQGRWSRVGRRGAAAAALALCATTLRAQGAGRVVAGTVRDSSGAEIAGAEVEVSSTLQRATTDVRGTFVLYGVPADAPAVRVRRLGFRPDSAALRPGTHDTTTVDVRLVPIARRLSSVVVHAARTKYRGRLAGYYQRLERRSSGDVITRAEIERENPRLLTHMLQRVPGLQSARGRGSERSVIRMRGRSCAPLVWVDGSPALAGDVDLDSFSPESIEGVELYLGATGAPGTFQWTRESSNCGTIMLWSRESPPRLPRLDDGTRTGELQQLVDKAALFTAADVDAPVRPRGGAPLAVAYPPSLHAAGAPGLVVAEFVVDTAGRAIVPTIGIVSSTDPLFGEAVRDALPRAAFDPAIQKGRRVPQLVQQVFEFVPNSATARGPR